VRRESGFTLIELLVGLALSMFIISSGVEFFALAQKAFHRLKAREEAGQAALAAIDRMRIDLLHAGQGLAGEVAAGLVEAVQADEADLRTKALEKPLVLAAEIAAGAARLPLVSTAGIAAGQEVVLRNGPDGETRIVAGIEPGAVVVDRPVAAAYEPATTTVSLVETVCYFLDGPARILRRSVNGGSAQPVLENASASTWTYDPAARLARIRIELNIEGAHPHEATVFIKNAALANSR